MLRHNNARVIAALMLELSTALIELSIVRTPKEKGVEMERKGDLVCHRAPKKRKNEEQLDQAHKEEEYLDNIGNFFYPHVPGTDAEIDEVGNHPMASTLP